MTSPRVTRTSRPISRKRWPFVAISGLSVCLFVCIGWYVLDAWTFRPKGEIAYECEGPDSVSQICIINADGNNRRLITSGEMYYESPAWSPDGRFLAFIGLQNKSHSVLIYDYFLQNTRTLLARPRDSSTDFLNQVVWSPSGNELLLDARLADRDGIYSVDVIRESADPSFIVAKGYAPTYRSAVMNDGSGIIYIDSRLKDPVLSEYDEQMSIIDMDGANGRTLPTLCDDIAISPDNTMALCAGNHEYFAVNLIDWSRTDVKNWAIQVFGFRQPAWSPDGQYIVYKQQHLPTLLANRNGELWIMRADGSHPVKLTNGPNDRNPAWRPQP